MKQKHLQMQRVSHRDSKLYSLHGGIEVVCCEQQKSPSTGSGRSRNSSRRCLDGKERATGGAGTWQVIADEDLCLNTKWLVFVFMFGTVPSSLGL